jgi:putative ABC transport system permease protein
VVGAIMAIGAVFGALNTMFAAVAARAREIATLRAIGFRGLPVVVAIMLETMLLALIGGALGGAACVADIQRLQRVHAGRRYGRQLSFELNVAPQKCCGPA